VRVALVGPGILGIPPEGWGAIERIIWNLHRRSPEAGIESVVVNPPQGDQLCDALRAASPDVIHVHATSRLRDSLPYLIERPTPLITTSHDYRLASKILPGVAQWAELSDSVIASSPSIRERLGAFTTHVHYIPNGVDTRLFRPLPKKPNTVLAIGRNTRRKRFADIARFFLERPGYHLTLCGPDMCVGPGDERRPEIPIGPNIVRLDNQPEDVVARLLGESEYFVHLCELEACALVVREAMACGCRVWTVPANTQDLTNVALSWDAARTDAELGARAAREAAESFDWEMIARRYADVYAHTLARWRGSATSVADARRRYEAFAARSSRRPARLHSLGRWMSLLSGKRGY
jgi:glycosyltransferase involved in cell wall biosynthesis